VSKESTERRNAGEWGNKGTTTATFSVGAATLSAIVEFSASVIVFHS
jgi:hypothetical protein